jgi:hypothetical protein
MTRLHFEGSRTLSDPHPQYKFKDKHTQLNLQVQITNSYSGDLVNSLSLSLNFELPNTQDKYKPQRHTIIWEAKIRTHNH